ncbi:MAG: DNA repair protein RecN [Novosphingobium sp.]|nr:DNA repair protein RecN [Novosphingobium sp.]
MLTSLSIRNVVLIEALELAFGGGLRVLTGETGAGKSILLDALGLALGERADSGLVRAGEEHASVTATFEFDHLPTAVRELLAAVDIELDPGEPLITRRRLRGPRVGEGDDKGAGSKAFVNDQPVSAGLLRELARHLVEIHGQHDDRGLTNPRGHRALLDRYARGDVAGVEAGWRDWRAAEELLAGESQALQAGEALAHDPERLDRIETRLFELRAAARKHAVTVDALPEKMRELRAALDALETEEGRIAELAAAARVAGETYRARAEALHANRVAAALRLDEAVAAELAPLKLDAARFRTAVTELAEERWGPHGIDSVEFLVATNPGADFGPLARIASGGELSRFILALKVALAEQGGAATVIFDEIDRGVGGAVASAIGERLSRLASGGQLLIVTHSPQVAARGDTHYVIAKTSEGTVTRTSVHELDPRGRQEEIARMLSGAEITAEARAQADRLLEGV